ncbi:MAG: hypothetical protein Q9165_001676 [Trypethelium subeluteriae]
MSKAQINDLTPTEQAQPTTKPQAKTKKNDALPSNLRELPERRVDVRGRINRHLDNSPFDGPLAPEDVLFRHPEAPIRYEEDDLYFQNEKLSPDQRLPDSDLLKAIHAYASDYYFCNTVGKMVKEKSGQYKIKDRDLDFVSMDETALLAMGILMEEAARQRLGETGDLALVEAEDEDEREWPMAWNGKEWVKSAIEKKDLSRKRSPWMRKRAADGENQRKRARTEESEEDEEAENREEVENDEEMENNEEVEDNEEVRSHEEAENNDD